MEEMLKSWFPNVKLQDQVVVTQTEDAAPSKKLKVKFGKQPGCVRTPDRRVEGWGGSAVKDIWC